MAVSFTLDYSFRPITSYHDLFPKLTHKSHKTLASIFFSKKKFLNLDGQYIMQNQ